MQTKPQAPINPAKVVSCETALEYLDGRTDEEVAALTQQEAVRLASVIDSEWCYLESVVKNELSSLPMNDANTALLAEYNDKIEKCRMASHRIDRLVGL